MASTHSLELTTAQRTALRHAVHRKPRLWREARDRAMALLVLAAHLRPAEVADLRVARARAFAQDRWDPDGRTRRCGLAREALAAWLACRAEAGIPGDWAFTGSDDGAACSPRAVYRALRRVLRRAGVDPNQIGRLDVSACVRGRPRSRTRRSAIRIAYPVATLTAA